MRRSLAFLGLAACLPSCASLLGYDDLAERVDDLDSSSSDVAPETPVDAAPPPAHPPDRPPGARAPSGKGKTLWFMMKRIYLGSQTSTGVDSPTAWREWGFDLDGRCTGVEQSRTGVETCARAKTSDQDVLIDGDLCRDNNFGARLIPLVKIGSAAFEDEANKSIVKGNSTWLIRIDDLDDGEDDAYAPGRIYQAGQIPKGDPQLPLRLDGTDVRTVQSDSIEARDIERPKLKMLTGYVRGNTWVSGDGDDLLLPIPVGGSGTIPMPLVKGRMTMRLAADHKTASGGILAGALPLSVIDTVVKPIAIETGFCPGTPLYETTLATVLKFPDVVIASPTLNDPDKPCDGVSIGLGFETAPILAPTKVVDPPPPVASKCGDAGI